MVYSQLVPKVNSYQSYQCKSYYEILLPVVVMGAGKRVWGGGSSSSSSTIIVRPLSRITTMGGVHTAQGA